MSLDPRFLLARDGAADVRLQGLFAADVYRAAEARTIAVGRTALRVRPEPNAALETELLFGEAFDVLLAQDGWAFGQARRDGYVGWARAVALRSPSAQATHRVRALRTAALAEPHARAAALRHLPLNALARVERTEGRFALVDGAGWVPRSHLSPVGLDFEPDPAAVAERHLGAPYLWGGRTTAGIDCSGLVQQALFACGLGCPRDSDLQGGLGRAVTQEDLARNDLVVWPGHIGLMVDGERLVHASGVQMAVVVEPLSAAVADRLEDSGPPTAFRRL